MKPRKLYLILMSTSGLLVTATATIALFYPAFFDAIYQYLVWANGQCQQIIANMN